MFPGQLLAGMQRRPLSGGPGLHPRGLGVPPGPAGLAPQAGAPSVVSGPDRDLPGALTAQCGCPPGPRPPAGVGALAGELGDGAAHAGRAQGAAAAIERAGLHVGLQRQQAQAVREGRGRQQLLALGALGGRGGGGRGAGGRSGLPATLPGGTGRPLTCSEQDPGAGVSSGSLHTSSGLLTFCMFPNSMALKRTPGGGGHGRQRGPRGPGRSPCPPGPRDASPSDRNSE